MLETRTRSIGATELRTIEPGTGEYRRWIDLSYDAYPIARVRSAAQRDAAFAEQRDLATREPEHRVVGAYREGVLAGGMRVYDFTMCVRGAQVFTGGVGSVAVALEHKRRGVARDLVAGFLHEYVERGAALATLFPFRPSFYRKLGFGYGTKLDQYRIALAALPEGGARERVRRLTESDLPEFAQTYARVQARTNGLMVREMYRARRSLQSDTLLTFGYADGQTLRGYITLKIELGRSGTINRNELVVHEFVYETPAALAGLLAFVRSQADAYGTLVVNTQDPDLYAIFSDPRNGSDRTLASPAYHETNASGTGIMYRIIDLPTLVRALAGCRFGTLSATVRIDCADAFFPSNAGSHVVRLRDGYASLADPGSSADIDLAIDVADLSAVLLGSLRLRSLVRYGCAVVSDSALLPALDAAFATDPPQCLTSF